MTEEPLRETLANRLLEATLPHVPFDGWSEQALDRAAGEAGISAAERLHAFPNGAEDALNHFMNGIDAQLAARFAGLPLHQMKLHEKIRAAILLRLELSAPHREAIRRALAWYALPFHAGKGMKRLYKTVDAMWRMAGDAPTDFSFYTKRMTLAGVYSSTLLFWLNDGSDKYAETERFLDNRLRDVLRFHQTKLELKKRFSGIKPAQPKI